MLSMVEGCLVVACLALASSIGARRVRFLFLVLGFSYRAVVIFCVILSCSSEMSKIFFWLFSSSGTTLVGFFTA